MISVSLHQPPEHTIAADDITFLDFGQILEAWEADFDRTYVLGDEPAKIALRDALESVWERGCNYFHAHLRHAASA
ncbi:M24 family metallopeptidase [Rhodococcus sp. JVH1]|uniref:M24 family metallopeptidase n=1 Tax=Rhodococcus sp. JVH1 TaxID=745408 RepID=UPI000271EF70|nr:aminopeptidase domain protein [Rhodococcus sp. JVH1]